MSKLVTIYPAAGWYVPGVPAIPQDVTPERAAELLAYQPPAFTTDSPDAPASITEAPRPAAPPDSEEA